MKARPLLNERYLLRADSSCGSGGTPEPVRGSVHRFKYALAYVVAGVCVLRYDNEAGKGDHRHVGGVETEYRFTSPEELLADFWRDVDQWRPG